MYAYDKVANILFLLQMTATSLINILWNESS